MTKSAVEKLRRKYEEAKGFSEETAHEAQNALREWQNAALLYDMQRAQRGSRRTEIQRETK